MMYYTKWKPKRKENFILNSLTKMFTDLPLPSNMNYYWNFGSLLSLCLMMQLITGMLLAMHYCPEMTHSFDKMTHITRNMSSGHMLRNTHANSASIFFLCVYLHISRNIYHNTWKNHTTWTMGMTMYLMMMMTAFTGYVLPWGQMSFWAATVITNLFSAMPYMGNTMVLWMWGSFSMSNPTLNRFYSLHYLLPFMLTTAMMIHMMALHHENHSNPTGTQSEMDILPFHQYLVTKDLQTMALLSMMMLMLTTLMPYSLTDPENFMKANPLVTPTHMQPEWYFLFAYSMLRSMPNKLGGMLALMSSMMMLYLMLLLKQKYMTSNNYRPNMKLTAWLLSMTFLLLTWMGSVPAETPYTDLSLMITAWYFLSFTILLPTHNLKEKKLYLATNKWYSYSAPT